AQETGTIERDGLGFVEHIDKTVPAKAHGTLRLITPKGSVGVKTWDQDEVRVEVAKETDAFTESSARETLAEARTFVETSEAGVVVRVESDEDLDDLELEFHFSVPRVYNLDLNTAGGSIEIGDNLEGWTLAKTAGGSIEVGHAKGRVEVETAGGSIQIAGISGSADPNCRAHTAGGSIAIGEVAGAVEAETAGGSIDIAQAGGVIRAETAGGSIEIGEGSQAVYAETSGGSIQIGKAGGLIEAETAGGSITIGPTGGAVKAETAGGSITVGPTGGNVVVETAGGGIRIGQSQGSVDAETAGGGITVDGSGGPVRVSTSGGGIQIDKAGGFIEAETAGGGIEAELALTDLKADGHCTLKTAGGNLTLYLPGALPATIDAQLRIERKVGRDYRIYSDFPITIQGEGTKLITGQGQVNGGGNPIKLYTTNGDIYIKKGPK
ncbi:MAG: DUF4097 family beta strand repeat protein, partial [Candidatus Latescibacteria bacterium]|nr:DUF4097 family beta strand repeat protein [Candidatus Latescibacterota bacterium]